jgi:LmbE family N-acetylglucosaminyl deacetylase
MSIDDEHRWSSPSGLPVGDLMDSGSVTVDVDVPTCALAIGAHPDDIEFGCGATLAKWAAAGCRIHHLVLTDGSKGSWDASVDTSALVEARASESRRAAATLDGRSTSGSLPEDRVMFLGRVDGELVNGREERRDVCRIIRELRPDVILGHDPWRRYRLHPDHRSAGYLTLDGLVAARDPHFFSEMGIAHHRPERLLLWEPDLPNHVEDASGYEDIKLSALLCHASQRVSTMGIGTENSSDPEVADETERFASRLSHQLAAHGSLAGMAAGEAFHRLDDL